MLLGSVDIYVRRVRNSAINTNRRGEVSSPNGLGNPPLQVDAQSI